MNPILQHDDVLIPLTYGESSTVERKEHFMTNVHAYMPPQPKVKKAVRAPKQFIAPAPIPAPAVVAAPVAAPALAAAFNQAFRAAPVLMPAPVPVPAVAPIQINFWQVIGRIAWVDKDDDFPPTKNPARPSQKLTFAEWQSIQHGGRTYIDRLTRYLDGQDFWNRFGVADDKKAAFIWHVIGRGQQIYDAVLSDVNFGVGFVGQDCGFIDFMRTWA